MLSTCSTCPTKSVKDKTLVEAWSEQKSSIYCIYVLDHKRHKLEDKTIWEIFLRNITQQNIVEFTTHTQRSSTLVDMLKLKKVLLRIEEKENFSYSSTTTSRRNLRNDRKFKYVFFTNSTTKFSSRDYLRQVRCLVDIYETCNMKILEF